MKDIKDKFNDMFKENKRLDNEIKSLSNQIEDLNLMYYVKGKLGLWITINKRAISQIKKLNAILEK